MRLGHAVENKEKPRFTGAVGSRVACARPGLCLQPFTRSCMLGHRYSKCFRLYTVAGRVSTREERAEVF